MRKRYHKDILSSPVLMLNFCPNLLCEPLEPHRASRELLFLVDRSGSMSGPKIQSVKVQYGMDFLSRFPATLSLTHDFLSPGSHGGCTEKSPSWHKA